MVLRPSVSPSLAGSKPGSCPNGIRHGTNPHAPISWSVCLAECEALAAGATDPPCALWSCSSSRKARAALPGLVAGDATPTVLTAAAGAISCAGVVRLLTAYPLTPPTIRVASMARPAIATRSDDFLSSMVACIDLSSSRVDFRTRGQHMSRRTGEPMTHSTAAPCHLTQRRRALGADVLS